MKRLFLSFVLIAAAFAADQKNPAVADSGKFTVLMSGKRVAVEQFTMKQHGAGNSVSSKLEFDDGKTKAQQQSELELGGDGSFRKYTWEEVNPGKGKIVAEPQDKTFVMVRQKPSDAAPIKETPHPLDVNTINIIDTNFYSHLEVLMWRYLAMSCKNDNSCQFAAHKFPVFVPYQEMSQIFTVSYTGTDSLKTASGLVATNRFRVQTENGDIDVWMEGVKMLKLQMPGSVQVIRE
jgi:hypothetical protein